MGFGTFPSPEPSALKDPSSFRCGWTVHWEPRCSRGMSSSSRVLLVMHPLEFSFAKLEQPLNLQTSPRLTSIRRWNYCWGAARGRLLHREDKPQLRLHIAQPLPCPHQQGTNPQYPSSVSSVGMAITMGPTHSPDKAERRSHAQYQSRKSNQQQPGMVVGRSWKSQMRQRLGAQAWAEMGLLAINSGWAGVPSEGTKVISQSLSRRCFHC